VAQQPLLGWIVRRREQRNAVTQQHGYNSHLDGVHVAGIQKGAKEFATAGYPNIFGAAVPGLQRLYLI
jgi:hypothetical protein